MPDAITKVLAQALRSGINQPVNKIMSLDKTPLSAANSWGYDDDSESFEGIFTSGREIFTYIIAQEDDGGWSAPRKSK